VVFRAFCHPSGAWSGHTAAYSYLPASETFPPPAEFMATLERAGFTDVGQTRDPGIVYLYRRV
jgi:hypothetical protein